MDLFDSVLKLTNINVEKVEELSPLVLAYAGDAVYELFIRTYLIGKGDVKVNQLHKKSINYVKAKAQAQLLRELADLLDDGEKDIVRRARNIRPASPPKNSDIMDYRYATGLEALIGYHYLSGNHVRLYEIMELCLLKSETNH